MKSTQTVRIEYFSSALRAVCELMRSYGIRKNVAEDLTRNALRCGFSDQISSSAEAKRFSRIADVCARWHLEKRFVDSDGKPKALRWNGKSGNLMSLVQAVVGKRESLCVLEDLFSQKLVKKTPLGTWLPKSKIVPPIGPQLAQSLRSATMVERLLRTIIYNSELKYKGEVLLEVMAQVPRLPVGDSRRFKKFAKSQGVSFAKTVDDWLESRNVRRARGKKETTREAGIVAFAFMLPPNKNH